MQHYAVMNALFIINIFEHFNLCLFNCVYICLLMDISRKKKRELSTYCREVEARDTGQRAAVAQLLSSDQKVAGSVANLIPGPFNPPRAKYGRVRGKKCSR